MKADGWETLSDLNATNKQHLQEHLKRLIANYKTDLERLDFSKFEAATLSLIDETKENSDKKTVALLASLTKSLLIFGEHNQMFMEKLFNKGSQKYYKNKGDILTIIPAGFWGKFSCILESMLASITIFSGAAALTTGPVGAIAGAIAGAFVAYDIC